MTHSGAPFNSHEMRRELITPETAEVYLEHNRSNRPIRRQHIIELSREMSLGRWRLSPTPIVFDESGHLIDGQHRLHAVIRSGVDCLFYVTRNWSPDVRMVIDRGYSRSVRDVLHYGGESVSPHAAAVIRLIFEIIGGKNAKYNPELLLEVQRRFRNSIQWFESACTSRGRGVCRAGPWAGFVLAYQLDESIRGNMERFISVYQGNSLPECPGEHTATRFREYLIGLSVDRGRTNPAHETRLAQRVFKAYLLNEFLKTMRPQSKLIWDPGTMEDLR